MSCRSFLISELPWRKLVLSHPYARTLSCSGYRLLQADRLWVSSTAPSSFFLYHYSAEEVWLLCSGFNSQARSKALVVCVALYVIGLALVLLTASCISSLRFPWIREDAIAVLRRSSVGDSLLSALWTLGLLGWATRVVCRSRPVDRLNLCSNMNLALCIASVHLKYEQQARLDSRIWH